MKNIFLIFTSVLISFFICEISLRNLDINQPQVTEKMNKFDSFPPKILGMFSNLSSPDNTLFNDLQEKIITYYCCKTHKITKFPNTNVIGHVKKYDPVNNNVLYDAKYSINSNSRRMNPIDDNTQRTKGLLFLGGSFTFGEGVQDNETFPYYFSKIAKKFIPYNISVQGYSLSDLFYHLNLKEEGLFKNIPKAQDNIAIYYFIGHHIRRSTYPLTAFIEIENLNHDPNKQRKLKDWYEDKPFYFVKDNELELKGIFRERVLKNKIYSQLSKLKILSMTGIADFVETSFNLQDFKVLINKMHERLKVNMNVSKFFIIIQYV